jgi:Uma2 family endonuclease
MEATAIKHAVTLEEYLAFERDAAEKHIMWDGEVFAMWAMAGASPAHNTIATNALVAIGSALRRGPWRAFNSDQKVWVPRKGGIVYPDVTVVCGRLSLHEKSTDVVTNPSLVIEVLSPGTESFDRAEKFAGYRSIETLRHYVMVSSREVLVEQYLRHDDGTWTLRVLGPGDVLSFTAPALTVTVDDLYERAFDDGAAAP